jgi:phage-related baseplate assembly protein
MSDINDLDFVETDARQIYNDFFTALTNELNEDLFPGDERRMFGEAWVAVLVQLMGRINDQTRQRLLRYMRGSVLTAYGEDRNVMRIAPSPAKVTVRFCMQNVKEYRVTVPQGTKVGDMRLLYFATTEVAYLNPGDTFVDILCESIAGGSQYTGLIPGTIKTLVDLIPDISSVENITTSYDGDDGEPEGTTDGDNHYRERIRLSQSAYSTAGSEGAYKYIAMSADPDIVSVSVESPEAGHIRIVPLMRDGQTPTQEILDKIISACNDRTVRPMGDFVTASPPNTSIFDIELTYYVTAEQAYETIPTVENEAISHYIKWQTAELGRSINPDQLRKVILDAGALRLDIVSPAYVSLNKDTIAQFSNNLTINREVVSE